MTALLPTAFGANLSKSLMSISPCSIVEFSSPEEAAAAIATFNDTELNGRKMQVREVSRRWICVWRAHLEICVDGCQPLAGVPVKVRRLALPPS